MSLPTQKEQAQSHVLAEDASKNVLCCGTKTWTLVIAVLGMVDSLIFMMTYALSPVNSDDVSKSNFAENIIPENESDSDNAGIDPYAMYFFKGIIGFALAVILFVGAHQKKPFLLSVWLIATGIQIAVIIVGVCFMLTIVSLAIGFPAVYIGAIAGIYIGVYIFCFWVVSTHRKELLFMQSQTGRNNLSYTLHKESV